MDEKIHDLFVRRMGLILDKRKDDAAMAAMQVRSEAMLYDSFHSKCVIVKFRANRLPRETATLAPFSATARVQS